MKAIGVRELRQRASEFLRDVERGQSIEVTAHGRPIARLVPARSGSRRDALVARDQVVPGRGNILDVQPVRPRRNVSAPSRLLADARRDER